MDSDASENYDDLHPEEESQHAKLVDKILSLNKAHHVKKPARTEPSLQISEFNLVKSITGDKGTVQITDLTKPLKKKKSRVKISENVKRVQRTSRTLPKPLEKPQATRIRRSVAYEKTRLELDRWEATVAANRSASHVTFPLKTDHKMGKKSEDFSDTWRIKSELDLELEKNIPKVEQYDISLEEEKFPLTMKEMLERRKEAAKLRAFQSYKESKARRQNKIKSKKYHRIQKKERIKKQLKEFEELQKTNPEEALKKLEEIEKTRIEERFSLRHKGTGKWARNQQIRAKYDKESRQNLAQQLALSRELTEKTKVNDSESEEEVEASQIPVDDSNPWMSSIKPGKDVSDFISGYRKYWLDQNKTEENANDEEKEAEVEVKVKKAKKTKKKVENNVKKQKEEEVSLAPSFEGSTLDESPEEVKEDLQQKFAKAEKKQQKQLLKKAKLLKKKLSAKKPIAKKLKADKEKIDLSLPLQKKTPQLDEALDQTTEFEPNQNEELQNLQKILAANTNEPKGQSDIDPNKYLNVKTTHLTTAIPDILATEDNEENDQRAMISEAFQDDDIVEEFNKSKKEEMDKDKPKSIDLSLPGWGSWGGKGIKVNKRKKRRFIIKAPAKIPRRDDNKGFLIVNEKAQSKIKEHQVSEVPFPFKNVKDFEASMRAPISNSFVPETAYRKLIMPAVRTKMGAIIEPMSKDILVNKSG